MTQRFDLTGKVVVVTGGTGLLGSAYCQGLAEHGAQIVMADLAAADPVTKAAAIQTPKGPGAWGMACDVGVEADVVALFQAVMTKFGRVDAVLNNAAATGEHLAAR
jgi:NAD(P)-dependent dehydrogenase (short-subunit alcohol dehydrogenase family)